MSTHANWQIKSAQEQVVSEEDKVKGLCVHEEGSLAIRWSTMSITALVRNQLSRGKTDFGDKSNLNELFRVVIDIRTFVKANS